MKNPIPVIAAIGGLIVSANAIYATMYPMLNWLSESLNLGKLTPPKEDKPDLPPPPETIQTKNAMGLTYLNEDKTDLAIGKFKEVLATEGNDDNWEALNGLGMAYYKKGWYREAVDIFAKVIEDNRLKEKDPPTINARYGMAKALAKPGDYDQALYNIDQTLNVRPNEELMVELKDQIQISSQGQE